jgi:hypothetical protein
MPRSPQGIGLRDVALTPVSRSWKPAGSVFWCGQDLGSIEGHYRALADSKHPFDRTSFGTPRTGVLGQGFGDPIARPSKAGLDTS